MLLPIVVWMTFALFRVHLAEISIDVTPKAFAHVFKKEFIELRDQLLKLRPEPLQSTYLGLELTIDHLQIVDLKMPHITYETSASSDTLYIKLLGGAARLLGQYSAIYKTKREGQFELDLDHFVFTIPVQRDSMTKFTAHGSCSLDVDEAVVVMTPPLPEQITKMIRSNILEKIQQAACSKALPFLSKLEQKLNHLFEFTDISEGNRVSQYEVALNVLDSPIDHNQAFHVSVSESVINAELSKLFSAARTRFLWNGVPEIQDLLNDCDQPECRMIEDGDLISSLHDRPSIRILEDSIHLHLPLSTSLTRGNTELFTVITNIELKLTNVELEVPQDGFIDWSADYEVLKMDVLQTSSSRNFQKFASTIESKLMKDENKLIIEQILSTYLRGSLPIHISSAISWNHPLRAIISPNSLQFHLQPHFTPSLRILA